MTPIEFHTAYTGTPKKKYHEGKEPEDYYVYDCPFCDSSQHLYFFPENTVWDCKKCGEKGNVHTFNKLIYNEVCTKKIDGLRELWELPARVFEGIKYNPLNNSWVIPTFRDGKLNNLYKIAQVKTKDKETGLWKESLRVMGTPSLTTTLFNWTTPESTEVWICEGQKDKLAGDAIRMNREIQCVGVPGASSFNDRWVYALQDKDVVILFDNDEPGQKGARRIIDKIAASPYKPKSVKKIEWPDTCKVGYDLYDVYKEHQGRAYTFINSNLQEVVADDLTKVTSEVVDADESCDSFDKLMDVFGRAYHLTTDMRTAMAVVLASIYSTNLEGEQVWVKLIGRPGCGKSTISKAISASEFVQSMSTFTGLFSGWKDGDDDDPSLIPLIKNRTLVVKDADALLKQPNIAKIMSELRDFYDKDSTVHYNNRQRYNYQNIRSTFIMMGTQVLRRADQSFLGERLISLEMDVTKKDEELIEAKVVENSIKQALKVKVPTSKEVMSGTKGYIGHLKEKQPEDIEMPSKFTDMVVRLCRLAANMRTIVDRDNSGKLLSPAIPEMPTRLIGQFINTAISLCVVLDQNEPNDDICSILKKLIKDTINPHSYRFQICDLILDAPGITAKGIQEKLNISPSIINSELNDLIELKFVDVIKKVVDPGRNIKARGFMLSEKIKHEFEEITK